MHWTLVSCNYNTSFLIENLLKSAKFSFEYETLIMDTGKFPSLGINQYHMPNSAHGPAVNKAFELVTTDYMLLVDSDVIFYKDIAPIVDRFIQTNATLLGNVSGDRGGKRLYPRVDPWFCLINLRHLKEHGIQFFDPIRTKDSRGTPIVYDIGSTMFEDVMKAELTVANFNGEGKYFKHYEGMSWRTGKFDSSKGDTDIDFGGTHNNQALYEYGLQIENQYMKDIQSL